MAGLINRRTCQLAALAAFFALASASPFSGEAQAATVGTLTQLGSPNGCVVDATAPIAGCGTGRALLGTSAFFGSHSVALSPDGKNLYAASFNSDAVTAFSRDSATGKLTQLFGDAGCTTEAPDTGCAKGHGLVKPTSVAVSPDGKSVYVASIIASSVTVFNRSKFTGELTQQPGTAGCISHASSRPDCASGRALDGADVVDVSPDGRSVYAGSFKSDAIVIFDRNRSTGGLAQKPGAAGCIVDTATSDCQVGRGLKGAEGLTVSPDGKSVYVGAAVGNTVAVFTRNRSTGALTQPGGTAGCAGFQATSGCANADGTVGADALQVSPDNKNLYVASGVGSSVAIFKRSTKTGLITQLAGTGGCYSDHQRTLGRCTAGVQLDTPEGIAVSPDGLTVYVGSFNSNAVTVFDRVTYTGTITQRPGANGCIVNAPTSGCTTGTALGNANGLAISPFGGNIYVGAYASNAISTFGRAQPRNGHVAATVPSRVTVAPRSVISLPVTCSGTRSKRCPGGVTLQASSLTLASSLKTVGRASFNIPRATSERVSIKLSSSAHRYLLDNGRLPVVATLRVVQPSGRIETFRRRIVLAIVVGNA